MEYRKGLLRSWHDVPVLFQNPAWQAQTDTAVSLWVSRAKYQFRLRSSSWPFCSNSPEWRSRHIVTWFGRHGDAFGTTENAFFRAFINLRSQFHLHHRLRALTEIVSKITPDLSFKSHTTKKQAKQFWQKLETSETRLVNRPCMITKTARAGEVGRETRDEEGESKDSPEIPDDML